MLPAAKTNKIFIKMKKFQQLIIRHSHDALVELLDTLKKQDKGVFTFKRNKSNEYARNIFHTEDTVGCFSTERKTLAKASVWVVITNDELKVTNITPNEVGSLGVVKYNEILLCFFNDFVAKKMSEDLRNSVVITGEEASLADVLSHDTYEALQKWERCCNHSSPVTNDLDRRLWFEFVGKLHNDGTDLSLSDFAQWLEEDCKWPSGYTDIIYDLQLQLEYSLDLLKHYDGND